MIDWKKARCAGSKDPAFFPDDDVVEAAPHIQVMCAMCPINAGCLAWALEMESRDGEAGVWGGTTPFQRRKLKVVKQRQSCPVCGDDAVVAKHRGEICISCGASWLI
jgi:ribosomal protein S27AE